MKTQRKMKELRVKAAKLAGRGRSRRQREVVDEIGFFLSKQSLAELPSSLKEKWGVDRVLGDDLYSIFMFELLHNLHFGVSSFLKPCLIQYLCSDENYSHPGGLSGVPR